MKPKISIIIPSYNEEKLLPRCLTALKNQNYPKENYEIMVLDNGSTDQTAQSAKKMGATVYLYTKVHKGGAILQFGAKKANAPIIAFTDADTKAPSDWLKTAVQL